MTAVLDAAPAGEADVRLPTGTVFWPCIHGEDVRGAFLVSVVGMLLSPSAELIGNFYDLASGPVLSIARNTCARALLESPMEWLWFVDSDTVFSPTVLPRLMALADPAERPIVSAAVPISGKNPSREFSGLPDLFWAAYRYTDRDGERGLEPFSCAAELGEVERVDAVGTGCMLIHRSVFEAIGPGPFNELGDGDAVMGEDLSFCYRADKLGIPIHLASQVRVGHAKVVTL